MAFIASSSKWGDQAVARLCEVIIDSNDGMAQQVMENKTDLLDLLTVEELLRTDDLGLSLPYLAVHYDQPDMIGYLHRRGLDLDKPCDALGYGNAMFYAVAMSRHRIVMVLYSLSYSLHGPCETWFRMPPLYYAQRRDDRQLIELIQAIAVKEAKATVFFRKNVLRQRLSRAYQRQKRAIVQVQRMVRGLVAKRFVRKFRNGEVGMEHLHMLLDGGGRGRGGNNDSTVFSSEVDAGTAAGTGEEDEQEEEEEGSMALSQVQT